MPQDKGPDEVSGPDQPSILGWTARLAAATARAALPAAGVVHDLPDGRGAAAALRRAAQATIHLAGCPRSGLDIQGGPHIGVTEYIAGTNNHGSPARPVRFVGRLSIPIYPGSSKGKTPNLY